MTTYSLNNSYFSWLCRFIGKKEKVDRYSKLLRKLYHIPFRYMIPRDGNREADGIDLRYRFGSEEDYSQPIISSELDSRTCSVLEMMVALSIRIEEQIMGDPDTGDRPDKWFWLMIENLGLIDMDNEHYIQEKADLIINNFLDRKYSKNGEGSLFVIKNVDDIRGMEIWYQMCHYLNETNND